MASESHRQGRPGTRVTSEAVAATTPTPHFDPIQARALASAFALSALVAAGAWQLLTGAWKPDLWVIPACVIAFVLGWLARGAVDPGGMERGRDR